MLRRLPELIYPLRLARSRQSLAGRVSVVRMHRLSPLLAAANGAGGGESDGTGEGSRPHSTHAEVELRFGADDLGLPCVQGTVTAELRVICQRCLEPMPIRVESEVRLGFVSGNEEEARLSPGFDPLVAVEDEAVSLTDLVEDELILAIPAVPIHPGSVCAIADAYSAAALPPEEGKNPFAVLADMKTKR